MAYSTLERIIENILCSDKSILAELLKCKESNLSLIARQKSLNSGKLDLLYLYDDSLILIELKVVPFYNQIIEQISGYFEDLKELQRQNKLINANIRKIILVVDCDQSDIDLCRQHSIELQVYKPEHVLSVYYENFKANSYFLSIQSGDYGVTRLGLLNSTLTLLAQGEEPDSIAKIEKKSIKTIRNRLSVAMLIGLVGKTKDGFFLSELGDSFINARSKNLDDRLTEQQSELLSDFVKENPFFSSVTYTTMSLVETVFVLAKSKYPVDTSSLESFFVRTVGKEGTWKTPKARKTATYIFSNYACDLQFLSVINRHFYISPREFRQFSCCS